jgi:hypothetical protein
VASGRVEYKRLRYERLCAVIGDEPELSIHDVGFGLGHLRDHLCERFPDRVIHWSGSEVTEAFVEHALAVDASAPVMLRDLAAAPGEDRHDYVILAGTFYHLAGCAPSEFDRFFTSLVTNCWKMCRRGLAFNVVTDAVDYRLEDLYYPDIGAVIGLVRGLTRFFELDHATPLYEYTIRLYRPEVVSDHFPQPAFDKYLRRAPGSVDPNATDA